MIEAKVSQGAAAGAVTGCIVWALIAYVPSFHEGVPVPVVAVLPFALAWVGHVLAAWHAPHTPIARPLEEELRDPPAAQQS